MGVPNSCARIGANGDAVTAALGGLPDDAAYWDAVEAARAEVARSWHVA